MIAVNKGLLPCPKGEALLAPFAGEGAVIFVYRITSSEAGELLREFNFGNRKLRPSLVRRYLRDMNEGRWGIYLSVVTFGTSGRMLNGQHTLAALSQSTMGYLDCLVAVDVDESAFESFDIGGKRSPADILRTKRSTAAMLGSLVELATGETNPNTSERSAVMGRFPGEVEKYTSSSSSVPAWAVAAFVAAEIVHDCDLKDVFDEVSDACKSRPIVQWKHHIGSHIYAFITKNARKNQGSARKQLTYSVFRALERTVKGEKFRRMKVVPFQTVELRGKW